VQGSNRSTRDRGDPEKPARRRDSSGSTFVGPSWTFDFRRGTGALIDLVVPVATFEGGMSLARPRGTMRARKLRSTVNPEPSSEASFTWTAFDRAITEALYRQHAPFVAGFLERLGVPARYVEQDVLRVFAEVNRCAACVPSSATLKAWVASIALGTAMCRIEVAKTEHVSPGAGRNPDDLSLAEFLMTLEPALRATFILFELEGEPSESIAAAFDLPVEAVHESLRVGQQEYRRAYCAAEAAESPVEDDGRAVLAFVDPVSLV
jgi:RNA polymerase sigma-70 factor (ECF subfamily)